MELVAVCDIDRARADSTAQQYSADAYYGYQDLLTSAALMGSWSPRRITSTSRCD
jgi:predicted dehydrogenase